MDALNVTLSLDKLRAIHESDTVFSPAAEPYMWAVFFKLDADTVTTGKPSILTTQGNRKDLGDLEMSDGAVVSIPPRLGRFTTVLKPLPLPTIADQSRIGVVAVVLEQDDTADHAIAKGHAAFNLAMREVLDGFVKTAEQGKPPTDKDIAKAKDQVKAKVIAAIKNDLSGFELLANQDDVIGIAVQIFTLGQIQKAAANQLPISVQLKEDGVWQLIGHVKGTAHHA